MPLSLTPLTAEDYGAWQADLRDRFAELVLAGSPGRSTPEDAHAELARALPDGLSTATTDVLWVTDDGRRVGHVWLTYADDECVVRDVRLDDSSDASALLPLVMARANDAGAGALSAWHVTGDPSHDAFVAAGDFAIAATNMARAFDAPQPAPDTLRLRPMTADEFADWQAADLESYIAERARNGESLKVARQTAEAQRAERLPAGLDTDGHGFWIGQVDGSRVGILWLDLHHPYAFVFSVAVDEAERGRGYGRALMQAGAHAAQEAGATGIALNVFGDNVAARRLYDSLGYRATQGSVRMGL